MEKIAINNIKNRHEFRIWLEKNHLSENECWIYLIRKKPQDDDCFYYLDAIEEALCFGWIDSTTKRINGKMYQRFSPRKKNSPWSILNIERAKRLIKLNMMTEAGFKVLPSLDNYIFDNDVINELKMASVWDIFTNFPLLYQKIRIYNVSFYKDKNKQTYNKALNHLIEMTKINKMYGNWNDYGRLLNY